MSYGFSGVLSEIQKGMHGDALWIPFTYPALSRQVGITKHLYHLFGGDPGSGKTSFVDQTYVLDAHEYAFNNPDKVKLKTVYFSMERSQIYKKTKWLAHRLYTHNNILRSVNDLLSFGTAKYPVTDELYSIIESHESYFNTLYNNVRIIDGSQNPTGIWKFLYKVALQNGIIYGRDGNGRYYKTNLQSWSQVNPDHRKIYIDSSECPVDLPKPYDKQYIPNDPKLIIQVVADHFGRLSSEQGLDEKANIDKCSRYLSELRDFFGISVVGVSQFNRNNANIQRRINTDLTPEQQDFKSTGNTFEDADIVFGLFNPHKHGLNVYKGFNIAKTKDNGVSRFRAVALMKNSYGADNLLAAFKFVGECGYYKQLGNPNDISYEVFKA